MPRPRRAAAALTSLMLAVFTLLPATPARADDPFRLNQQLTDRAGVLGSRAGEANASLQRLQASTGLQLFVVFVHTFSGDTAQQWTDATAARSGLGDRDALLSVATHDRVYAYSFPQNFPLTNAQLADVAAVAIEPPLAQNDWAGAVVGASNGYAAALAGQPIPAPAIQPGQPDTDSGGGVGVLVGVLAAAVVVVVGIGAYTMYRRRRRPAANGQDQPTGPTTVQLQERANTLLIELDNELRSSEQELAIAQGQYGAEATAQFTAAYDNARTEVAEAFRLRMTLDEQAGDEAATRATLGEIIRRCEEADKRLDAESDNFDRLRAIEAKAPELSVALGQRATALQARLPAAESAVADLGGRYARSAIATVAANPAQARERIGFATTALARADAAVTAGRRPEAALAVRAAEEALRQAGTLLDSVDKAGSDLANARAAADALLVEIDGEVTAARAAPQDPDGALAAAAEAGAAAAAQVRAGLGGQSDPLADLRRLQDADAGLDRALAASREQSERVARARAQLTQTLPVARAEVAAADQYLTTRRAAVGMQPRGMLSEAHRQLARAEALAADDPLAALSAVQEASRLASDACQAAYPEVDSWQPGYWGQPRYGRSGGGGDMLLGAMLGGILAGGGGSRYRRRYNTGWGGGFGGSVSRGRRSGGGGFGGGRRGGGGRF
ncbi:TPM domain-containing protein [Asanoa sp. NPDC049573]|uniref:TPM domain-containing protein n=1 Tax=Asanoa sp. NPDC049573 TaxID=3155396 RepID=UPI003422953E